ncbi:Type I Iterative PKS [Arachnomyces sp. PD_36]|nr:Type I Iterative PKS [Arachnomyces sp. PD_36]
MGDMGTPYVNGVHDAPPKTTPIAIVGMGCRFGGGVTSPEKLWDLVAEGRSAWSDIPADRYNRDAFYHPDSQKLGTSNVKGGYFLEEDVGLFDPSFFNFTAEVAASMDPQIRLLLEVTYEAFESAGIPLSQIAGSNTSVFTGSFIRDYHDMLTRDPITLPRFFTTGNFAAMIANRISHFFDLRGPSTPVDTGCSTSITALHLACQTLRTGESDSAVVGGTCIMLNPDMFAQLSSLGFIGPDGKSYAFDSRAQGYGRGEGIATLILKRLDDALRDGDPIRAVIRETGMNQDGKTPTITSPSGEAQEALMRACYDRAGLDPQETTYVEAHGTGTKAGDPIEAAAIGAVFGTNRSPQHPVLVGSVKSNLGHTEAASGLAAIIKVAKALERGQIPPSINLEQINSSLDLRGGRLKIAQVLDLWPSAGIRRASVNNFGYGGSNTHVIMEDALDSSMEYSRKRPLALEKDVSPRKVFVLSAKDEGSAKRIKENLLAHLESSAAAGRETSLQALSYTLGQRRSRFPYTIAFSAASLSELSTNLANPALKPVYEVGVPRLGFVFTGQGSQWHAMGRELIKEYPVFYQALQEADAIFREFGAPWSCVEELARDSSTTLVNKPMFSFPLSCLIQLALVRLLASWGVRPTAVTGHSSGEVAAAYASGALSFREALAVTYFRGLLTSQHVAKQTSSGGMLAVGLGKEDVQPYLNRLTAGVVVIACVNSPSSVTISGDLAGIEELQDYLNVDEVFARRLKVESAYHSHHMLPLQKEYRECLKKHLSRPHRFSSDIFFSSPVSGDGVDDPEELGPEHWVKNMLNPVLFDQCLRNMCVTEGPNGDIARRVDMVIELGPHGALAGPIRQCLSEPTLKALPINYTSCLTRNQDAVYTMQTLASTLIVHGYPLDLSQVNFPRGEDSGLRAIPDLPSYPWNHSQRFWNESRASREHRFREHPHHELLGTRVPSLASNLALWRLLLRPSDMPWIRDHLVQTDMVYPGAGCLAMAIEAMRQISVSESSRPIRGYRLRQVEITRALIVPDTSDGVEVQLLLKPHDAGSLAPNWRGFQISSATVDGEWTEHCRGFVGVDIEEKNGQPSKSYLSSTERIQFDTATGAYFRSMEPEEIFQTLRDAGIHHGPLFQKLISIRSGSNKAVASFSSVDSNAVGSSHSTHVIHPITLDSIFQAAYATLSKESQQEMGAAIPRSIKEIYVSQTISHESNHVFQSFSNLENSGARGFSVSMALVDGQQDDSSPVPVLEIEGMHYQSLGPSSEGVHAQNASHQLCLTTDWKEDIILSDTNLVRKKLSRPVDPNLKTIEADLTRVACQFAHEAIASLTEQDITALEPHHKQLFAWMQQLEQKAAKNQLAPRSSRWAAASDGIKQMLFDRVTSQSLNGQLLCRVGPALPAIFRKEVTPLQVMEEGQLLDKFHEKMLHKPSAMEQLVQVVDLYAHHNPRAKILEVGAGTGTCAESVLQVLAGNGPDASSARFCQYTVTDLSLDLLANDRFAAFGDLVNYQQLNIEEDPADQGFETGSYDLVIASLTLHEAKDIHVVVGNARQLLKHGGKLILLERIRDTVDVKLIFGTLSQWWQGNDSERQSSPSLSISTWNQILSETGFTGIDLDISDCDDEEQQCLSVIVSTAVDSQTSAEVVLDSRVSLVYSDEEPPQEWVESLTAALSRSLGCSVTLEALHEIDSRGKLVIFVSEIATSFLRLMNEKDFNALRKVLTQSKGVMWATRGAAIHSEIPDHALHAGMLRTCRLEDSSKKYISLDLDPANEPWDPSSVQTITDVFDAAFNPNKLVPSIDSEYVQRNGSLLIPRVRYDVAESEAVTPSQQSTPVELQPFNQPGRHLRLFVQTPGLLDSLVFKDDSEAEEPLPEGYVEIEPRAFGVNFRDIMVAMGQLEEPQMGFECAGIVTRAQGSAALHFRVGDRVCAFTGHGHWANRTRVPWTSAARIPDHMEFETAASIPMAFGTAYYCLFESAHLEAGETVLIHAASGGVGQASILLAQWKQADVFATVGTPEKKQFLIDTYGIPEDHIFSSRDPSFAVNVKSATGGKGVDVVLNSLAGELLDETWHCLAPYGRFIEIGKKDIQSNKRLEMRPFQNAVTFSSFDLVHLGDYRGPVLSRVLRAVVELLDQAAIRPISPTFTHPISDLERVFRQMQAGKHIGKMIVVPQPGDKVKVTTAPKPVRLSPEASYLVVGGLGGIGRSIARWLVQHGAKYLILLSRSAASRPESHALVNELREAGCEAVVENCDVSKSLNLGRVLGECQETMPAIRGVIQGAMNIQDSILEEMSFQQWQGSITAKVHATRNLHEYFGKRLDFFVMLSSVVGVVGNPSQANYGAGGSYQDALARHRASLGLPGVSLDLGMVKSVGYVAENKSVGDRLVRGGYRPLDEDEVLRLVEAAIRQPIRQPASSQIITGISSFAPEAASDGWRRDARFAYLQTNPFGANNSGSGIAAAQTRRSLKTSIAQAASADEIPPLISHAIVQKLSEMFAIPETEIDESMPLSKYGVDSLVAVELRNWLVAQAGCEMSIFDVLGSSSLFALAEKLAQRVK